MTSRSAALCLQRGGHPTRAQEGGVGRWMYSVALLLLLATWLDASSAQNIALMALLSSSQSALGTSVDWWSCYKQGPPQTCTRTACATCSGSYKGITVTCRARLDYERCTTSFIEGDITCRLLNDTSMAANEAWTRCPNSGLFPTPRHVLPNDVPFDRQLHALRDSLQRQAMRYSPAPAPPGYYAPAPPPPFATLGVSLDQKAGEVLGMAGESMLLLRSTSRGSEALFDFNPDPAAGSGHAATSVVVGEQTACILLPFVSTAAERTGQRLNCVC